MPQVNRQLMTPHRLAHALLWSLAAAACRNASPSTAVPDAAPSSPPDDVATGRADVDAEALALARRWQGVWVLRDADYVGSVQAWNVHGDAVTVYDASRKRTREDRFAVPSPCRVSRARVIGDDPYLRTDAAEWQTTFDTFVFASDGLHVALAPSDGGFRRGARVMVCLGDHLVTFGSRGSSCSRWGNGEGGTLTFPTAAGECAIEPGPAVSFTLQPLQGGDVIRVPVYGDALMSAPLFAHVAEPEPSFQQAQREADALVHRASAEAGSTPQ
jgi:hypothetical protein